MSTASSPSSKTSVLRLQGVGHRYGAKTIFSGVSWCLEWGSRWSLLGSSGEGKSTLLALMAGAVALQEGRMYFQGAPYAEQHQALLGRHPAIGYLAQQDYLQPVLSVVDNIAQAQRHIPERKAKAYRQEALERLGLAALAGQAVRQLSGGQRQRVALAALLAGNWSLLLLDEPFGELDFPWRMAARRFLADHAGEAAVVLVSHDPAEALPFAGSLAYLDGGRLQIPGTPRRVFHHPPSAKLARITGEVNELDAAWREYFQTEESLVRPSHIRKVEAGGVPVLLKEKAMGVGGEHWWIGQENSPLLLQMAAPPEAVLEKGAPLEVNIKKPPREEEA